MPKLTLEDFIYESLTAISQGVMRAKRHSEENNTIPIALAGVGENPTEHGEQLVRFSVSVEVTEDSQMKGSAEASGGIVSVISGKIGAEAGKQSGDKSAHVIEFSVPMNFNAVWRK